MRRYWVAPAAALLLSGCAVEQPKWVTDRPDAYCYKTANDSCLADLISAQLAKSPEGPARDEAIWRAMSAVQIAGTALPDSLKSLRGAAEAFSCTAKGYAWDEASKAALEAKQGRFAHALASAKQVEEGDARTYALSMVVQFASEAQNDKILGEAVDLLSQVNERVYMSSLLLRLQVLLAQGDLERSSALQNHLLAFFAKDPATGVEPATEVAISYLARGMKLDARDFIAKAGTEIPGVRSADNMKLFSLTGQVIDGYRPIPDDFYQFSSDDARLRAYLVLASYYRNIGDRSMVTTMLVDASRFTQKASFKADRTEVAGRFASFLLVGQQGLSPEAVDKSADKSL